MQKASGPKVADWRYVGVEKNTRWLEWNWDRKGRHLSYFEDRFPRTGLVPARYVRHSQMCPQLDVSDKNDQKTQDMSDKNDKKPQDMSDNNYFVFCWHFPEKTLIIPMRIHQAHACTLLNM